MNTFDLLHSELMFGTSEQAYRFISSRWSIQANVLMSCLILCSSTFITSLSIYSLTFTSILSSRPVELLIFSFPSNLDFQFLRFLYSRIWATMNTITLSVSVSCDRTLILVQPFSILGALLEVWAHQFDPERAQYVGSQSQWASSVKLFFIGRKIAI